METLGSASVICSDKTGTLTRNEMTVERGVVPSGQVGLTGTGYSPQGSMTLVALQGLSAETEVDPSLADEVMETLMVGSIANDGGLRQEAGDGSEANHGSGSDSGYDSGSGSGSGSGAADQWQIIGDPTEVSLIVAARKVGADTRANGYDRLAEIPFTSEHKLMSVLALSRQGSGDSADAQGARLFCKGAPDVLLGRCDWILQKGQVRPSDRRGPGGDTGPGQASFR